MQPVPPPRFDELQSVIFHLEKKILVQSISVWGSTFLGERSASKRTSETKRRTKRKAYILIHTFISYLKEQVKQDGGKVKQVQQIKHKHSVLYNSNSW